MATDGSHVVGSPQDLKGAQDRKEVALALSGQLAAPEEELAAEQEEPRVTATFRSGKIEQVLLALSTQANVRITAEGKAIGQRVDLIARDVPLSEALDTITQPVNLVWWKKKDGSYGIADKAYYETNILPGDVIQRIFRPDHISAEDFEKAIKGILTPKIGKTAVDPRTNKVIVTDLPAVIEAITRLLQEIDVQMVTRVFQIYHADVSEIAKQIEDFKSGPGSIKVDVRSHQIIVEDLLQNIKRMEMLIDVLDVGPEIIVYDVNNIGMKGDDLKNLQTVIDTVRTKDLLFEINEKQGTFILEDVPEVHDKVEKILRAFDQPMKQTQVFAEVLTTNFKSEFSFGMNLTYSEDLFSAARDGLVTLPGKPSGDAAIDGGYLNLDDQFPVLNFNSGFTGQHVSRNALFNLQAAMNDDSTNVLLQPRLFVKNQEDAFLNVGSEEPFLTTFLNDSNNINGRTTFTRDTVTAGLTMKITPTISNNGLVELAVEIEDSDAQAVALRAGDLGTVDQIRRLRRRAETVLLIPSGETRMIGGLLRDSRSENLKGLPWLIRLPILGPLFGNYTKKTDKQNLLVFLTPTIIEERPAWKKTESGRRGRSLTLEEALLEEPLESETTPTLKLLLEEDADSSPALSEARSAAAASSSLLSDSRAEREMPYLLGHEEAAKRAKSARRDSSYVSQVGGPSGAISTDQGGVSAGGAVVSGGVVSEPEAPPPDGHPQDEEKDQGVPGGVRRPPITPPVEENPTEPPPPSERETNY